MLTLLSTVPDPSGVEVPAKKKKNYPLMRPWGNGDNEFL